MVRELCSLSPDVEKQLKDAINDGGGAVNGSALFLLTTSTATYVPRASYYTVNMRDRCIVQ